MPHLCIFALVLALAAGYQPVIAYFDSWDAAVRPMGMGGAFIGLADDAAASAWNPGGLYQLQQPELLASSALLYTGLDAVLFDGSTDRFADHFISYAHPIKHFIFAVTGRFLQTQFYDEHTFMWTQSAPLTAHLGIGISLKMMHARIEETPYVLLDPDLSGLPLSRTGATFDIGIHYRPLQRLSLGIRGANLRPVHMNWLDEQGLPAGWALGLAHYYRNSVQLLDVCFQEGEAPHYHWGTEYWFLNRRLAARLGTDFQSLGMGWGLTGNWQKIAWQIDYAILYPVGSLDGTFGSHHFGMVARF